jgi:hypothetical protein
MTIQDAVEMVRKAGTIRIENGRVKAGFPEDERARLQPALNLLRTHPDEVLRLLTEPTSPMPEPAQGEPEIPKTDELESTGQISEPGQPEPANAPLAPAISYAPTLREREALKIEGDREAHDYSLPLGQRCRGLLRIIEAHFSRSLDAWEFHRRARGGSGEHGYWHEYVASWLWANGYRTDAPFQGLELVCEELRKKYPAPEKPMIGEGRTYWGTGDNHQLRNQYNSPPVPGKDGADPPSADETAP